MIRSVLFISLVALSQLMSLGVVHAQEPQVIPQTVDQVQFKNQESKYFELLEEYRRQEQTYGVTRNQYLQLNTLASQELAVQEARRLSDLRAEILLTYLDILDQVLSRTRGIPIENKNSQKVSLGLLKEKVTLHRTNNSKALDRLSLDNESRSFVPTFQELESSSYYTLSLIRLGEMQEAYDKTVVVKNAVYQSIQESNISSTQKAEKERGFQEIERTLASTNASLSEVKIETLRASTRSSLNEFTTLSEKLNETYAQLSQVIEFLQEVRR